MSSPSYWEFCYSDYETKPIPAVGSFPRKLPYMGSHKLCACNPTREVLISQKLEQFDTVHEAFLTLIERLSNVHTSALWLNPFRGIPKSPRFSRFDMIHLDDAGKVMKCTEGYTEAEKFAEFDATSLVQDVASSVLILPSHALQELRIHQGDQIKICGVGKVFIGACDERAIGPRIFGGDRCIKQEAPAGLVSIISKPKARVSNGNPAVCDAPKPENRSLKTRVLRWIFPQQESGDRRRGERIPAPDLVAYYWTGGAPQSFELQDVSDHGLYLLTEERWLPGTRIVMTLQRKQNSASGHEEISRVESQVVRWGEDGVGFEFVESGFVNLNTGEIMEGRKFDRPAFQRFLKGAIVPAGSAI